MLRLSDDSRAILREQERDATPASWADAARELGVDEDELREQVLAELEGLAPERPAFDGEMLPEPDGDDDGREPW